MARGGSSLGLITGLSSIGERYGEGDEVDVRPLLSQILRMGGVKVVGIPSRMLGDDSCLVRCDPPGVEMNVQKLTQDPRFASEMIAVLTSLDSQSCDGLSSVVEDSGLHDLQESTRNGHVDAMTGVEEVALSPDHLLTMIASNGGIGPLRLKRLPRPTSKGKLTETLNRLFGDFESSEKDDEVSDLNRQKAMFTQRLFECLEEDKGTSDRDRRMYEFFRIVFTADGHDEIVSQIIDHCYEIDSDSFKKRVLLTAQLNLLEVISKILFGNDFLFDQLSSLYGQLVGRLDEKVSKDGQIMILALYIADSEVVKGLLQKAMQLK